MRTGFRSFVFVLVTIAVVGSVRAADFFVSGIEDLPLMPGLTETQEGSLVFESATGRFVEVYAVGDMASEMVTAFYSDSLPQLGWSATGATMYRREGEILVIEYLPSGEASGPLTVRFALSPAGN